MKKLLSALLMGASLLMTAPVASAQEQQLRIGTLVPKNSLYHRQLMLVGEAWRTGAAIETIHLKDLEKIDLSRFKVVVFANTWLMSAAQRKFVREKVHSPNRRLVFQGFPAYTDRVEIQ